MITASLVFIFKFNFPYGKINIFAILAEMLLERLGFLEFISQSLKTVRFYNLQ